MDVFVFLVMLFNALFVFSWCLRKMIRFFVGRHK